MEIRVEEALRYLGVKKPGAEALRNQVKGIAEGLMTALQPKYTYRIYSLRRQDEGFLLAEAGILLTGQTARQMLNQCRQAVLLACTLGIRFDAMLRTEQARDMAKAVMLDACGNAWVEAGCDAAEEELKERFPGRFLTDRFSPGYGDLPLALQPEICAALDTPRRLGVYVTSSYLMNPSKTVTAIIGLADEPQAARIRGCAACSMRQTCTMRKEGKRCGF